MGRRELVEERTRLMVQVMSRLGHSRLSPETLAVLIERVETAAMIRGHGQFEAWNGRRLVWVKARKGSNGRLYWSINDQRIAQGRILSFLLEQAARH
jgi:hypothetical protein